MLLFADESGQDLQEMPCVVGGIAPGNTEKKKKAMARNVPDQSLH